MTMKKWTIEAFAASRFMAAAMLKPATAAPIKIGSKNFTEQYSGGNVHGRSGKCRLRGRAQDQSRRNADRPSGADDRRNRSLSGIYGTALSADIALGAAMVEKEHRMNIGQKLRFA
jgi:hypothetical protein